MGRSVPMYVPALEKGIPSGAMLTGYSTYGCDATESHTWHRHQGGTSAHGGRRCRRQTARARHTQARTTRARTRAATATISVVQRTRAARAHTKAKRTEQNG
eukprot:5873215-Prymnesium_polylepis.2